MGYELSLLLNGAAALLDRAGALEPVELALDDGAVQVTFAESVTMADQRSSIDRLAAATGCSPVLSELGADAYIYTLTADLPDGTVVVAGTHPSLNRVRPSRVTSTAATTALLRSLVPWGQALSDAPVAVSGLEIRDDGQRLEVRLLVDGADDPAAALSATVSTGVTAVRTRPGEPFGLDGRGWLPSGHQVLISIL